VKCTLNFGTPLGCLPVDFEGFQHSPDNTHCIGYLAATFKELGFLMMKSQSAEPGPALLLAGSESTNWDDHRVFLYIKVLLSLIAVQQLDLDTVSSASGQLSLDCLLKLNVSSSGVS